ncbi:MAG: phosphatase PAP2 family protein, partial [Ilumatobacteraceae bacterium]
IQEWSLDWLPLIVFSNYFYGSVYLLATFGIIIWMYRRRSDAYPLWRNTLAIMTTLGLVGFAFFPLMPPRLLDVLGDGQVFGFVDTLVEYPTFWSFDSEAMRTMSNPFAAMPSLHCAWAFWGACALYPRVRSHWARGLAVAYPVLTIYVVIATGNHFILDAVGGAVIFFVGYGAARVVTRAGRGRPLSERDDVEADGVPADEVGQPYRSIAVR